MTKSELTKKVKSVVLPLGLSMIINQTDRQKRKQESNNLDYFIYGKGYIIFLEAKIGKDKLSDGQGRLVEELQFAMDYNSRLYVDVITDKNYNEILNNIIDKFKA